MNNPNKNPLPFPDRSDALDAAYDEGATKTFPTRILHEFVDEADKMVEERMNPNDNRYPYAREMLNAAREICDDPGWDRDPRQVEVSVAELVIRSGDALITKYGSERLGIKPKVDAEALPDASFWSDEGVMAGRVALMHAIFPDVDGHK